ncbi:poly(R)-hydroxyalkanoic acid synthase, class III, PhaC subunit [Legionella lansingensis]|uniref:Alpha/beta hydrolase family protein n=1 Tax=Legionella lansingensis TaxID=45067 RepID=A0A0W0VF18_9GAMM|nr:DUF3141 domain-containing protein [Legionella lansingensis]KTD18711.1 Alpha/beta hydrolase family protein [Legionella lansingensis]SNV57533.1 poly(R)-hydroxyalkanoic acid synthase, class III, PhaC subunit [Legionella lansingensis]
MFFEVDKIQEQFQGIFEYSQSMASLWLQCIDKSLEHASRTTTSLMELNQQQVYPYPTILNDAVEYTTDFMQRSVLFWDIMRKRGNQYLKHKQEGQPPVLIFSYKMLMDGRDFERPVNYALVEIIPPEGTEIDPTKRPYVIVDPRAGHGAGISGFKDESQVGIALRSGHPVYVVIFFPTPEPNQTLVDVTAAHEKFLNEVALRHPQSPKPCVIGNCQGGWAILTLMAANPEVAGVAVINGAPLSYWGGKKGKNPMRYIGGILGGSWIAQLASDLGNGIFDGANLVMNFEMANPKVTYWKKYYNLFANLDKEETRFLNFERWWGGFSLMNANEMRGIVDNLFIGNKLVHGKIPLGESGYNLDLRDISVPIIIFCSEGDTITPPQQALNWIADLYSNTMEIKLEGQIIVYLIHKSIGHLGIFVSSEVAKKEHNQIIDLLNYIEHLAPGLYEMKLHDIKKSSRAPAHYLVHIEERSIADIGKKQEDSVAIFNLVRTVSEYNAMSYDLFVGPIIRNLSNEYTAELIRKLHPLRQNQYLLSDLNPLLYLASWITPFIRQNRVKISEDNPFLLQQLYFSKFIDSLWDFVGTSRDNVVEIMFYAMYGYIHLLAPFDPKRDLIVHYTEKDYKEKITQSIIAHISDGGVPEAILRTLLLLIKTQGYIIASNFPDIIQKLRECEALKHLDRNGIKQIVHTQTIMIEHDPELAFTTLPHLLKSPEECSIVIQTIQDIVKSLKISPSKKYKDKFQKIKRLLEKKR